MLVEMLLLVLIALAVFGFVLAPLILPLVRREPAADSVDPEADADDEPEPVSAESRPLRETS